MLQIKYYIFLVMLTGTTPPSFGTTWPDESSERENAPSDNGWIIESHERITLQYCTDDRQYLGEYMEMINQGVGEVEYFFGKDFKGRFDLAVHPNRQSLDSTWQVDWGVPGFRSQCWMVASGTAHRMDLLSPRCWKEEACEHDYTNRERTQQLITHELVHVFHGQHHASPDFSDTHGLDWFVEGLATYASGQCNRERLEAVEQALLEGQVPGSLDGFWKGNLRYGLSGSMVMYIDHHFGREMLVSILGFNHLWQLLEVLAQSEEELLSGWREFISREKI